jgi:predicted ATPase
LPPYRQWYKRNIPYATLAQALQNLVRQILGKSDAEMSRWRSALLDALGPNGQLMVNLIPELALIIGEQPPVPELPQQEWQNRFQSVFRRFLGPFFTIQFLLALKEEALLAFDPETAAWTWDLPRIHAKGFTDNIADLMAAKLSRLPPLTQKALGQLACLGNVAETATLTLVHGGTEETMHAALWDAVRAGSVIRSDRTYAFLHDRIQEAAYALIDEGERPAAHLRIGRLLAARTPPEELEENIFEVVNQFDHGAALIVTQAEREQVAELNLMAGKRAKIATAYASALQYLTAGRALLAENGWEECYRLTFQLELNRAECEYLTGELALAEEHLAMLLDTGLAGL